MRAPGAAALALCALLAAEYGQVEAQSSPTRSAPATRQPTPSASPGAFPLAAPEGRALLATGPLPIRGLPFFSPNAIPGLSGSYLVGSDTLAVWFSRDKLQFDGTWKVGSGFATAAGAVVRTRELDGRLVVAWKYARYSLIMSLPGDTAALRRFAPAFLERFAFFFDNAPTDAELSFPATVDY